MLLREIRGHAFWVCVSPDNLGHIRSGWNEAAMLIRGPLTDQKIARYAKQGWYSEEFREQRRQKMKSRRKGNFVERDGRWIYSPL